MDRTIHYSGLQTAGLSHRRCYLDCVCYIILSIFQPIEVASFTRRRDSSESIPVFITDVTCYGREERLIDCEYRPYTGSPSSSLDVHISCTMAETPTISNSTTESEVSTLSDTEAEGDNSGTQTTNIAIACSVTVILCFSMVVGLVVVYLIIVKQKKDRLV